MKEAMTKPKTTKMQTANKKLMRWLLLCLLCYPNVLYAQTTTTFDFSSADFIESQGLSRGENVYSVKLGDISITFTKGTDGIQPGYYNDAVTFYKGSTMTVASDTDLVESVALTFVPLGEAAVVLPNENTWTVSAGN